MNKPNWNDIRYVLAVAETGSLNAAATQLNVTHATVLRRVALFEEQHGQSIFQRSPTGYRVLPDAVPVIRAARNVRDAVYSVDRACAGATQSLSGNVRIASTDSLCQLILPAIVDQLSEQYPDLTLTLLSTNARHDFFRLSADIAVRPALSAGEGMKGSEAGKIEFALYHAPGCRKAWLGLDGPLKRSAPESWMSKNVPPERIVHRADSFLALQELAALGIGRAILPRFIADADTRLIREMGVLPVIAVPVWVATLEELAGNARFQAVQDVLTRSLSDALAPYSS